MNKSIKGFLTHYIFYPISDFFRGESILKELKFLKKTQWWSQEQIEELQNKKLQRLIQYAILNVPYYRDLFSKLKLTADDIRTKEDLIKLPILTKEILRSHPIDYFTTQIKKDLHYDLCGGSGSTGVPVFIRVDRNSKSVAMAALWRAWQWTDYKFGDSILYIWGVPSTWEAIKKFPKNFAMWIRNEKFFPAFSLREVSQFEKLTQILKKDTPDILFGYTNSIYLLALYLQKNNIKIKIKKAIIPTAETLQAHQRKTIESVLQAPIFDQYGCGETMSIAYECDAHNGYHIVNEHIILEFEQLSSLNSDLYGLIITDLDNKTMPLIRYKNGDLAQPKDGLCSCGRSGKLLQRISGRYSDLLQTKDGGFITIPGMRGGWVMKKTSGVKQYQVIQLSLEEIIIELVVTAEYNSEQETKIHSLLDSYLKGFINYNIEYCDYIPSEANGKYKLLISKLDK